MFHRRLKRNTQKVIIDTDIGDDIDDALKKLQAFDNLMEWVYEAYYEVERQINLEKAETQDDEWDMDM